MNGHWIAAALMASFVTACGSTTGSSRVESATTSVAGSVTTSVTTVTTSGSTITTVGSGATSHSESSTEISVNGGSISASVVNGVVEVFDVTTADGWTVDREDSEDGVVTLRFSRGSELSEVRLQLTADGGLQQSTTVRSTTGTQSDD